jgi:hypothetical protein
VWVVCGLKFEGRTLVGDNGFVRDGFVGCEWLPVGCEFENLGFLLRVLADNEFVLMRN